MRLFTEFAGKFGLGRSIQPIEGILFHPGTQLSQWLRTSQQVEEMHDSQSNLPSILRTSRWKSKLLLVTLLVLLVGAASAMWLWTGCSQDVKTRLAIRRSQGLPTCAREVNDFYVIPRGVADRTEDWRRVGLAVETANFPTTHRDLPVLGKDGIGRDVPRPGLPWDQLEVAKKFLADQEPLIQSIRDVASLPGQVRFPVDFSAGIATPLTDTHRLRGISRLLELDAYVSAHQGDYSRVLLDIENILTMSDAIQGEPSAISQLIRNALISVATSLIEKLAPTSDWTDAQLLRLQDHLSSMKIVTDMQRAIAAETAAVLSEVDKVPLGPFRAANQRLLLETMTKSREALSEPWPKPLQIQSAAVKNMQRQIDSSFLSGRYAMVSLLIPPVAELGVATARIEAKRRMATLDLAFYRHQRKHGHWPESLEQLDMTCVGKLPDVTIDPFNGKPFVRRQDETGWLIYSVYSNGDDDGGAEQLDLPLHIIIRPES